MELYQMIYHRLRDDEVLKGLTAKYNGGAAIFYQRPASAESVRWQSSIQYPRIDYTLDLVENPARGTSGVLTINVWCDTQVGAEPEDIGVRLRELLHATFACADDFTYCFAWVRSDAFEIKTQREETARTIGLTVIFDVTACPCQYTMYPDPIRGLNAWTRSVLPNAVIIGDDEIDEWLVPTRDRPAIYWRLTAQSKAKQTFACTWLNISAECHVYCRDAADRLYNLIQLNTAHALIGHITLEDSSPLFLRSFSVQPHMNYITTGQIKVAGNFGILQPESHFSNRGTGKKLVHTNIPREIIDGDSDAAEVSGVTSRSYKFPYPQSGQQEQTGKRPSENIVGALSSAGIAAESKPAAYVIDYPLPEKQE